MIGKLVLDTIYTHLCQAGKKYFRKADARQGVHLSPLEFADMPPFLGLQQIPDFTERFDYLIAITIDGDVNALQSVA